MGTHGLRMSLPFHPTDRHWPDACVPDTGHSEQVLKEWSMICVRSALFGDTFDYGTRLVLCMYSTYIG